MYLGFDDHHHDDDYNELYLSVKSSGAEAVIGDTEHRNQISLERVSIECRNTKTKVITLANQKGLRQSSKPIKTRSNDT